MPIYFAKAYLTQKGRLIEPNETLTLTTDQADRLGSKVEAVAKDNLSKKTLDQLKDIARTNNVAGFSTLNKDDLIAKLTGTAAQAVAQAATTAAQSAAKPAASATAQSAVSAKAAPAVSTAKAAATTTAAQPTSAAKAADQKAPAATSTAKKA